MGHGHLGWNLSCEVKCSLLMWILVFILPSRYLCTEHKAIFTKQRHTTSPTPSIHMLPLWVANEIGLLYHMGLQTHSASLWSHTKQNPGAGKCEVKFLKKFLWHSHAISAEQVTIYSQEQGLDLYLKSGCRRVLTQPPISNKDIQPIILSPFLLLYSFSCTTHWLDLSTHLLPACIYLSWV